MSKRRAATVDPRFAAHSDNRPSIRAAQRRSTFDSRRDVTVLGELVCVLIVGVHCHEDAPLFLAANRDEAYARRATVPAPEELNGMRALLPRDEQAGGTWIGINAAGLVAVLTNRRDGDFDRERRSRGLLCREILSLPTVAAAESCLAAAHERDHYNSFNLLVADRDEVALLSWNGESRTTRLGPGMHVLSNEHILGELEVPALERSRGLNESQLRELLVEVLGSHVRPVRWWPWRVRASTGSRWIMYGVKQSRCV
jgi:hypothetical protein